MREMFFKALLTILVIAGGATLVPSLKAQDIQVVSYTNTAWVYNDSSTADNNPGTAWRVPGFVPVIGTNINQWLTNGHGLFGNDTSTVYTNAFGVAGNGFRTPLNRNLPDGTVGRVTFYFITKFDWPFSPTNVILRGTNYLDDGAIVYLNGVEVFRARMGAAGTEPTWATIAENQGAEGVPEPLEYSAISLVTGQNTLAVEVHQSGTTSSDLAFATALRAVFPSPPTNTTPNEPSDRAVIQNRSSTFTVIGEGSPRPSYQWYHDNVAIPGATASKFTIAQMMPSDAGLYKVVLTNEFGSLTSRVATVTYVQDLTPPSVVGAIGSAGFTNVTIQFDEGLDVVTAADSFNYSITDNLGNPIVVTGARLTNGNVVILDTEAQLHDTVYTVAITAVSDLATNETTDASVDFRSWVTTGCTGLTFESYDSGATTLISALTTSPKYPNNPRDSFRVESFDSRNAYLDDSHENYGGRISGLFIPPLTGPWVFYLISDDAGELYLNPNGPSREGRIRIAQELSCCGTYEVQGAPETSAPYMLEAGHAYYIEGLYQEQGGGDYIKVAATLASEAPPVRGNIAAVDPATIPGGWTGFNAVPVGVVGDAVVVTQPLSQSVPQNTPTVTFTALGTNVAGVPVCYQWQKSDNGGAFADIAGATRASYSIAFPTVANDNGDKYRVVIAVPGASVTSTEATLTITADATRPTVTCVLSTSASNLVVYFSEPVDPATVLALNFTVNGGIVISGASVNASNSLRVDLTVSPLTPLIIGNTYQVTVTGVSDAGGNAINPNPTVNSVNAQNYPDNPDGLQTLPATGCLPPGCLTERGFAQRIFQVGVAIATENSLAEQILAGQFLNPVGGQPYPNIAPRWSNIETNIINYSLEAQTNVSVGNLSNDMVFPGFVGGPLLIENIVMESLTYVELKAGIHRWIVNSDDGFRVYAGLTATNTILGEFNGGRGSADTVFNFIVKQDCVYPFRLLWEQGQGGANVEFEKVDLNTTNSVKIAINGNDTIKAFQPPRVSIRLLANKDVTVSWGCGTLQSSPILGTGAVWSDVTTVSPHVTTPAVGTQRFYRVHIP